MPEQSSLETCFIDMCCSDMAANARHRLKMKMKMKMHSEMTKTDLLRLETTKKACVLEI